MIGIFNTVLFPVYNKFKMEISVEVPQKARNRCTAQHSYTVLGIHPRVSISYYRGTCSFVFIAALLTIAMQWKEPRNP